MNARQKRFLVEWLGFVFVFILMLQFIPIETFFNLMLSCYNFLLLAIIAPILFLLSS